MTDDDLISKFAAAFRRFGKHIISESTEPAALVAVYSKLPAKFSPLYEKLVLRYRWEEVDLGLFRLLANPPHNDLSGLTNEIFKDPGLAESLIPGGFIQFGKGPDINYDPVCFDIKNRRKDGDYRIVQIDHEGILSNYKIRIVAELAPSFRDLLHKILSTHV
jgi:hypothetical protein